MPDRPDRGDEWFADTEGNLSSPDDPLRPATDEFGREDPAALERERRRREREERRRGKRKARSDGSRSTGGFGRLLGRRSKPAAPPPEEEVPGAEPTAERPAPRRRAR
ncbi:MAG: hypothetical protein ACRDL6_06135, partial [Solirubrobacterales bacterium]